MLYDLVNDLSEVELRFDRIETHGGVEMRWCLLRGASTARACAVSCARSGSCPSSFPGACADCRAGAGSRTGSGVLWRCVGSRRFTLDQRGVAVQHRAGWSPEGEAEVPLPRRAASEAEEVFGFDAGADRILEDLAVA